ncbi:transcription termination factor NusA [Candidatus Falkowbacteria bacterium RIFOXYB2_FULL_38_15]|uniref:Transcription termination/antitermination protein NusA n=1 Tax=Candidatus Falkowbacteria bacterium RIFOXYA2_FULL_38_12 TaxID=1797993 RepID=A0A1F5S4M6_9BACT|nr:MAG: transcription termination factor NusA [Candidatus Falkowbacteria bacterium RIFOXYA2_FULL_38_12]OGF32734.1 MAG: transcription termination factor NusA [Candidatus Falkowbacteria bacterium RIFOXYB2_FULL_38_15]OGF42230.1 MAG: transcription termination factor NusA [Candidatus Falkowbacteria bacterium RIFOXYD2_FULL_39_16]
MASPIIQAIKQICEEKNIKQEAVIETLEAALAAAFRKDFGVKNQNVKVEFNPEIGESRVFDIKTVVADELAEKYEKEKEEREKRISEGEVLEEKRESENEGEEEELKFNPKLNLSLSEAKVIKGDAEIDEVIKTELEVPGAFGRMAAQTAKQVIIQRLREAERDSLFNEFKGKEADLIPGIIQRWEGRLVLVDLGHVTALMPLEEQIDKEKYTPGARLKFYVKEVTMTTKGPQVIVSRAHPEILRKLFTFEIPEVSNGVVEIKGIAREAGSRSKVAVYTKDENIDPIGSCIGQRGARIQSIINELGGEKVDIIEWNDDLTKLIANSLSPAKISEIKLNEEEKAAYITVKPDQLSLAIGRGGQNVRLAAKLTGWKINIQGGEEIVKSDDVEKIEEVPSESDIPKEELTVEKEEKEEPEVVAEEEEEKKEEDEGGTTK